MRIGSNPIIRSIYAAMALTSHIVAHCTSKSYHYCLIAQLAERLTLTQEVVGSNPTEAAITFT